MPLDAPRDYLVNPLTEAALLGALLGKVELLQSLPASFQPDHLAVEGYSDVLRAIQAVAQTQARGPVLIPVAQVLGGGQAQRAQMAELLNAAVSFLPDTVISYAMSISDLSQRRTIIAAADRLSAGLAETNLQTPASALVAQYMAEMDAIAGGFAEVRKPTSLADAIDKALDAADEASRRDGPAGLSTGFKSVDRQIGGLEAGTLTVLAGRPGMGKSAIGWQMAIAAARQGVGVLAVSLEMSAVELGRRALSAASGVPLWKMKRGAHIAAMDALMKARKELHGLPLTIEDGGGLNAAMIALKARAAQRRHGLGLVMVDHLHIVAPEEADIRQGATWAVGRISGAMKRLAKACECPVLLLAQLNRQSETREDKRPVLSDLRQAGDIEQDADAVAFVYRPEYYLEKAPPDRRDGETSERHAARVRDFFDAKERLAGKAELIVAKVRDGETGTVGLTFDGPTTSFGEVTDCE